MPLLSPVLVPLFLASTAGQPVATGVAPVGSPTKTAVAVTGDTSAEESFPEQRELLAGEARAMAGDISAFLRKAPLKSPAFDEAFEFQVQTRDLSEALLFRVIPEYRIQTLKVVNPENRSIESEISPEVLHRSDESAVAIPGPDRLGYLTRLPDRGDTFLYVSQEPRDEAERLSRALSRYTQDLSLHVRKSPIGSSEFDKAMAISALFHGLSEAVVFRTTPDGGREALAVFDRDGKKHASLLTPEVVASLKHGAEIVTVSGEGRLGAITSLPSARNTYVYAGRSSRGD